MADEGMDLQEIEDHIIAHQAGLIRSRYGEEEASKANYGWGIDEALDGPIVSTKVYGPWMVLTTTMRDGVYEDDWQELG